jgi:hypothetical protein
MPWRAAATLWRHGRDAVCKVRPGTVRATVSVEPRATLLPPDLFKRLVNDASWCNPQNIPEGLQVV